MIDVALATGVAAPTLGFPELVDGAGVAATHCESDGRGEDVVDGGLAVGVEPPAGQVLRAQVELAGVRHLGRHQDRVRLQFGQ